MTRSDLDSVIRMSGSIVLQSMSKPGISAYTSILSGLLGIITIARRFNAECHGDCCILSV